MKKRLSSLLLAAVLVLSLSATAFAATGLENFTRVHVYRSGQFTDLSSGHWACDNIATVYEKGLMKGESDTSFAPDGSLTLAATIALAARVHSIYNTGTERFLQGDPWYQCYVDYALENRLITGEYADYNLSVRRWEFAQILGRALPDNVVQPMNTVEDNAIPDVPMTKSYAEDVYRLYRAGILTGSDNGAFQPNTGILRAEAAALVSRMVDLSLRKRLTLTVQTPLTANEIYQRNRNAVFYIAVYDRSGNVLGSGSGVFLTADGVAVTNYHVIENAHAAKIQTADGGVYTVSGVYDCDADRDLAVLQIAGSGFTPATLGDSRNLYTGDDVYALGSPLGLEDTFSAGIISNPVRPLERIQYIQVTVPISHGSSGGALLNDRGELIGITSAGFEDGQNLNLAIPVYYLENLRQSGTCTALSALFGGGNHNTGLPVPGYASFPMVPDFGACFAAPLYYSKVTTDGAAYYYAANALGGDIRSLDWTYYELLKSLQFYYLGEDTLAGYPFDFYRYADTAITVATSYQFYQSGRLYYVILIQEIA